MQTFEETEQGSERKQQKTKSARSCPLFVCVCLSFFLSLCDSEKGEDLNPRVNTPAGVHKTIHTHTHTHTHPHTHTFTLHKYTYPVHCSYCSLNESKAEGETVKKQACERGEENTLELLLVALSLLRGLKMIFLLLSQRQWDLV